MDCEDMLKGLNQFIDDETASALCKEFGKHLALCNPCKMVVDNVRQTISLYKNGKPFDLPPGFEARLHDALRSRWNAKFPPTKPAGS